jgi:hypothetical protein
MPKKKYVVDLTDLEKLELEKLLKSGFHQSRKLASRADFNVSQ